MKDRTRTILKLFITTEYPLDLQALEEKFHISARTIRNELKEINEFLIGEKLPEIENVRKKGYQLVLSKEQLNQLNEFTKKVDTPDYLERENRIFDLILVTYKLVADFSVGSSRSKTLKFIGIIRCEDSLLAEPSITFILVLSVLIEIRCKVYLTILLFYQNQYLPILKHKSLQSAYLYAN